MSVLETVDRVFARLLLINPLPEPEPLAEEAESDEPDPASAPATRDFSLSLVFSAVRCILQYMILPVALPLIGLASGVSLPLVILLDLLAIWLLIRSLRYFWQTRHPRRFDMLPLSGLILIMVIGSLSFDLWQLFG